jgi:extradiol dioxygenase family protein
LSARPFHFSFHVRDLASTRRFYGELLGCREGRSAGSWVDFEFFGSQISAHLGEPSKTTDTGSVDLRDFSGNALEFKAFRHPDEVFSA